MNIGNGLNAIGRFTVDTALTVKDAIVRGYFACSSLAVRVTQIAARAIPNAVSNTVKTYPKSFCFAAGVIASGAIITAIASRALSNNKKEAAKAKKDTIDLLNAIKTALTGNDFNNDPLALINSELSKRAS